VIDRHPCMRIRRSTWLHGASATQGGIAQGDRAELGLGLAASSSSATARSSDAVSRMLPGHGGGASRRSGGLCRCLVPFLRWTA
jgi:hypothetical protein